MIAPPPQPEVHAISPGDPGAPRILTALLGIGFVEATREDFAGTPGYAARLQEPSGYLAASADFNGDGRVDQAGLLLNRERDVAYIVASIFTGKIDTYVLRIQPIAEAANIGIRVAPPLNAVGRPGIEVFALDGSWRRIYRLQMERDAFLEQLQEGASKVAP